MEQYIIAFLCVAGVAGIVGLISVWIGDIVNKRTAEKLERKRALDSIERSLKSMVDTLDDIRRNTKIK